ncbi:uncharacterized protein BJ212DRAFT_194968 [Suillus subaureus]|uniref:Uncharacterized protein n=1 Tax=Suillus subaureus TaxID=48587 RepID=A0A9P7EB10_9AGAM|nr:uncharacterized protein BJ212DRAFT_194968 [Suillus subaureus]KAG1816531.1 hypothetical protein BJ212DRAFT_194968 [Suillus subaureus]
MRNEYRDTVLICLKSDDIKKGHVQMNKVAWNNLQSHLVVSVLVDHCSDIIFSNRIHIYPTSPKHTGRSARATHPWFMAAFGQWSSSH